MPTREDVRHLKRFLDETADVCNDRLGKRLADLLTGLHAGDPTLFVAKEVADRVPRLAALALAGGDLRRSCFDVRRVGRRRLRGVRRVLSEPSFEVGEPDFEITNVRLHRRRKRVEDLRW